MMTPIPDRDDFVPQKCTTLLGHSFSESALRPGRTIPADWGHLTSAEHSLVVCCSRRKSMLRRHHVWSQPAIDLESVRLYVHLLQLSQSTTTLAKLRLQ